MNTDSVTTHSPFSLMSNIQPLEKIALTFSGGGYRAAAFALGTLSYFNRIKFKGKPLLQNVKAISTVSGGTIAGATYAVAAAEGKPFADYYQALYNFMDNDRLMETAISKLEDEKHWENHHKKQSLINAFADTYKELLTDKDFGFLQHNKSHLEDIIFNATEFNNGNAFRFQTTGKFGNGQLNCKELNAVSKQVLIADAIAASSCFPMGFEPIVFPDDFFSPNMPEYNKLKMKPQFQKGIGLMDGGIVDNQGVGSMLQANERRLTKKPDEKFDLLMICDVASPHMKQWTPESQTKYNGWRTNSTTSFFAFITRNWKFITALLLVFLGSCAFSVLADFKAWGHIAIWGGGVVAGVSFTTLLLVLMLKLALLVSRSVVKALLGLLPEFVKSKLHYFDELKMGLLERMIKERFTSTVSMTSEVFMKQIRRLTYFQVYENEDWRYRRTASHIYELKREDFLIKKRREQKLFGFAAQQIKQPSDKISEAAAIASAMPTTLWFTDEDRKTKRLDYLIACGQFTACFNLIYYLSEIKNDPKSPYQSLFQEGSDLVILFHELLSDWEQFNDNPLYMIN